MKEEKIDSLNLTIKELEELKKKEEIQALLFETESLISVKDDDKELEKFQLRNGTITSIREVKDIISSMARDYDPMFPNKKPFFDLMFKLNGWTNLNPKSFIKPPICAVWIKQYVYGRFDREILPTLLAKENPLITGYVKKYKLFQFLNDEGLVLLEGYIQDVIDTMKISKDWNDFEEKYVKLYDISVQLKLKFSNN
mgnify:CR=1 FL=1|tara:strand:- start:4017 stop:4607 length:591 start_codon:yes stop_codon:yes gene_type:complete